MAPWYRTENPRADVDRTRHKVVRWAWVAEAAGWWRDALTVHRERDVRRRKWESLPVASAERFTHKVPKQDASGWGWGGRAIGVERARPWTKEEALLSITVRELHGAVELFELSAPSYAAAGPSGNRVVIHCDNTGAVAIINRGGSAVGAANELICRLERAASEYGIQVLAKHVSGNR